MNEYSLLETTCPGAVCQHAARCYNRPMRAYGLTGGIASGKSLVARMFREEGVPVIDADEIARGVTAKGRPTHAEIVRAFGREILRPDGEIDRKRLGERVFSDAKERAALEAITHPAIVAGIAAVLARLAEEGHRAAIVEAAL